MAQRTLFQVSGGPSLSTVSIIGSAGRRGDAKKMTRELYWNMVDKTQQVISENFKLEPGHVHLVSGGAAWAGAFDFANCLFNKLYTAFADHIAVTLFLLGKAAALTLHIPADWQHSTSEGGCRFADNGRESQSNPGKVANKLHKVFGERIEEDTLQQIENCKLTGAKFQVHDGFKKRNDSVALSDYLIAFSWSEGEEPTKKGGTKDTWSKAPTGNKLHIPLSSLENNYTRKVIMKESSVDWKNESSLEIRDSPGATHAEQPMPQPSPTHSSHELPTSCTPTASLEDNSQSCVESLDSGLGSFDSSQSGSKSPKPEIDFQPNRKRKRSDSTDISDDSAVEGDDKVDSTTKVLLTKQSNSKKLKVSEFMKQALAS